MKRTLRFVGLTLAALAWSAPAAVAQDHQHAQPYAGLEARDIKALSADEVASLLAGSGMGFALAAELNGYPGPRHVLEMADELHLTADQESATRQVFTEMETAAQASGARLVELERDLDRAFRGGGLDRSRLDVQLQAIGAERARLRAVHLGAHLDLVELLTDHQIHTYGQLRGYAEGSHGTEGGGIVQGNDRQPSPAEDARR